MVVFMNLIQLFNLVVISHLKQQKLSVLFAIVSIVLGVSVYVTIRLTTDNILTSFQASTNYISEQNTVIISATMPIAESVIPELLKIPDIDVIAPLSMHFVKAYSDNKSIGYVPIIGIDILTLNQIIPTKNTFEGLGLSNYVSFLQDEPVNAVISKGLARKVGFSHLKLLINGVYKPIEVKAVIDNATIWGDEVIIVDIKNFQDLFKEYSTVNQLHLTFNTSDIKKAIAMVTSVLPPSLTVTQGNENVQYAEDITSTYRFNLNFLTCLALLVTAIIIYNAISHYVLERRRDFGIMLILGAQPNHLFIFTLLTSMLLAVFCSFLGLLVGYLITWLNIHYIIQTFSSLFLPLDIMEVSIPLSLAMEVILIVTVIALLVGIFPCLEAYKTSTRQTTFYQTYEQQFQAKIPRFTLLAMVLILISSLGLIPAILKWNINIVYISLSGILLGTAFFLPALLSYLLVFLRKIIPPLWLEAIMAVEHIKITMRKNVVAIAAMSITISLYLSAMIIIDSTRYTCTNWINQILSADIYINTKNSTFSFMGNYIANEMVEFIVNRPEVEATNLLTHRDISYKNKSLRIIGMVLPTIGDYYKLPLVQPMDKKQLQSIFSDPRNILISEHLAHEFNYHIGDTILIPGHHGSLQLKIANIFYNYANYQNILIMSNSLFMQLYDDPRIESALLYLKHPALYQPFLDSLKEAFPDLSLPIQNQTEVKNKGINMMEQTFKISKAIILAIFVLTALTLFNVLEQLILSRKHEFTIFWSIGANDYTLIKMCLWESFIIYIAAVLGGLIPTIIGLFLIFKFLTQFLFGINITFVVSYQSIISFFILLSGLVVLDGLLPAFKMRTFINVKGLKYE
ncbi:putative ABC-type transport system involved in lysophospholipase L1 biosynthesis, permease component [Legionella oakridgensis RV-2-2007]|nr:putative ABC-type transport system involved in lysophospholipase L1 biosynthesis, permease component [Legionella oakridgensis RV-2-2007]